MKLLRRRDGECWYDYYTNGDSWIARHSLAEDEDAYLLVPDNARKGWWRREFNARNPRHWPAWLLSRVTRRVVFVDVAGSRDEASR